MARAKVYPFLDWIDVWPGQAGCDDSGHTFYQDAACGVELKVQEAVKSPVFLSREKPWERMRLNHAMVRRDESRYRMWYSAMASNDPTENFICYAESDDGFNWERPELGLYEFQGSRANNILFDHSFFSCHSILVDESASAEQRYKSIDGHLQLYKKGKRVPSTRQNKLEIREIRKAMDVQGYKPKEIEAEAGTRWVVRGAVSADGLRWKLLEEPLVQVPPALDTQNVLAFDETAGEYMVYLRGSLERRRSLRRTGGPEFGNWPQPRLVFTPDPQDPVSDSIYNSAYCRCLSSGRHLMFPSMYHQVAATTDIQLASSWDGWNWTRPERRPIITRETDKGEYSCIYASPCILELEDGWGVPYHGNYHLHDWAGWPDAEVIDGEFRWARWQPGRLCALQAREYGCFTTVERECQGDRLRLNFKTEPGGWIRAAIVNRPGTPPTPVLELEGFELGSCDLLSGDELAREVTWNGESDLGALANRPLSVRIEMAKTKLFSISL